MGTLGALVGSSASADLPLYVLYLENGLASTAVGLVALAAYNLGNKICKTNTTKIIAAVASSLTINFTTVPWLIPACMLGGSLVTYFTNKRTGAEVLQSQSLSVVSAVQCCARI